MNDILWGNRFLDVARFMAQPFAFPPPARKDAAASLLSCFAPAGREHGEELDRKAEVIRTTPLLQQALDAMPSMVAILNRRRQIVTANRALRTFLSVDGSRIAGQRPGEVLGCTYAAEGPDGCGTGPHCAACGAVQAILASTEVKTTAARECRIMIATPEGPTSLDLKVSATPFHVGDDEFTLVAMEDISQAKRLAVLERTFFHDVLNTAGCIRGFADLLRDEESPAPESREHLVRLADQLIEEIQLQRQLLQAETGELKVEPVALPTKAALEELRAQYLRHSLAEQRGIDLQVAWEGVVHCDRTILFRVLGNMLKNALEASEPGETIVLGCQQHEGRVVFWVHNAAVMSAETQLQIFHRSFSTKARFGRGIGTYSMKLLGERYLGGKVGYASCAPEGTRFWMALPLQ